MSTVENQRNQRKVDFERDEESIDELPARRSKLAANTPDTWLGLAEPGALGHERSASCFSFRRVGSPLETPTNGHSITGLSSSSKSFGTFTDLRRLPQEDSQDQTGLTASDRFIIEYFTHQYQRECSDLRRIGEPDEQQTPSRRSSVNLQRKLSIGPPFVQLWDVLGPSAWCLALLLVTLVADTGLTVLYHKHKEQELFLWTLGLPHLACIALLFDRLIGVSRGVRQTRGCVFSCVASLWYIVATPFLRLMPVVTLMSSSFDKVLMLSGDPTDTTEFVEKHERRAFNDLVWFGPLYCLPMAGLQIYAAFFRKTAKSDPTTFNFQLLSVSASLLLAALVAATYSFTARHQFSPPKMMHYQKPLDSNPAQKLLISDLSNRSRCSQIIVRTFAWLCIVLAKAALLALLIKLTGPLPAVTVVLIARLPFAIILFYVSSVEWRFEDVLSVSLISSAYVVASTKLGPIRECLERPRYTLFHVAGCFIEATGILIVTIHTKEVSMRYTTDVAILEGSLLSIAGLLMFLIQRSSY